MGGTHELLIVLDGLNMLDQPLSSHFQPLWPIFRPLPDLLSYPSDLLNELNALEWCVRLSRDIRRIIYFPREDCQSCSCCVLSGAVCHSFQVGIDDVQALGAECTGVFPEQVQEVEAELQLFVALNGLESGVDSVDDQLA